MIHKILTVIVLFCVSCQKQTSSTTSTCFKVKRLHNICNDIIFEIKDPLFYHLGQSNWTDATNGITYRSVFEQKNNCETITVDANNEAMVSITRDSNIIECALCLALYPGTVPSVKLSIKKCP